MERRTGILRNEIPRKGTETEEKRMLNKAELQLRNEIPRKGTETKKHFVKRTKGGYIEKWDTPEGDGNITEYDIVSANIIEKWDTPEGDGNDSYVMIGVCFVRIEKWDTPEGDGNPRLALKDAIKEIEKWDTPEGDGN